MQLSFLVSWRNLTRHKKRFFFTLAAIVIGVAVMAAMLIAKETTASTMEKQERLYAGSADFWIQGNKHFFSEREINWLTERDEIKKGTAALLKQGFVDINVENRSQASVRLTGVSNFDSGLIHLPVKKGDATKEGLIITENAANLWGKDVGDTVSFTGMGSLEVTAIVYEGAMLNSPKTMEEAIFRHARVMVPLDVLQAWTGLEGKISNYRFEVTEHTNLEELMKFYQSRLSSTDLYVQPIVIDGRQHNDVEGMYFTFDLIAMLSIFISAFIAFNMIYASIVERKKEFAIMKSLGYTSGNITRFVLREIGILAVTGTMIGIPLGIWLGATIQKIFMSAVATQNIAYELELVKPLALATIVGIVFPFLAAAFPIYRAGNTPILEAMAEKEITRKAKIKLLGFRIVIGVICTVIGLFDNLWAFLFLFIGLVLLYPVWMRIIQFVTNPVFTFFFHYSGKQAIHSSRQFANRNANTSAMLAIGVSLALFMSALLESLPDGVEDDIRDTYGGDIHVVKETPWMDTELDIIQDMDGVVGVERYADIPNITWQTKDGAYREFSIMAFPENAADASIFHITEQINYTGQLPALYLGERARAEWGGEIGDVLTLNTPAGKTDFFVKGSVQSAHYSNYVAFVEEAALGTILNWPEQFHIAVDVLDETQIPSVYAQIVDRYGEELSNVDTITLNVEQAKNAISGMNELMQGLLLLVVALSAIGISNTLFMNTVERVKDIGTMRAIGFTKGQVRLMIIAEGLLIGVAGVVVGTLYGILVIYLNSQTDQAQGLLSFTVPWTSLLLAITSGILFTMFASWLPSVTASRVPIKEAINYE